MLTTTLLLLRKRYACLSRYTFLRSQLDRPIGDNGRGGYWPDDKPIPLAAIFEYNGFDDCLWALRAVPEEQTYERDELIRRFIEWCDEYAVQSTGWHAGFSENFLPVNRDASYRTVIHIADRLVWGVANYAKDKGETAWSTAQQLAVTARAEELGRLLEEKVLPEKK